MFVKIDNVNLEPDYIYIIIDVGNGYLIIDVSNN